MLRTRRKFLKDTLCAAASAGAASSLLTNLHGVAGAASPSALQGDYKALVCVFLYGGNDGDNTLIPYGQSEYNSYATGRGVLAIPRNGLLPITPLTRDGRDFAFHPSFVEMQQLFAEKKLALVANTGPLMAPTTRSQLIAKTAQLPPQLFSHNDQQVHWQTAWPDQPAKTGWGGRMADAINAVNGNGQVSMSISLNGSNVFQIGNEVLPYMVSKNGAISLWYYNEAWGNPETIVTKSMLAANRDNLFEKTYSEIFRRAIDNEKKLSAALRSAPATTTVFPANIELAAQLKMIARLISINSQLGLRRQVFFCAADGYDTHGEQLTTHAKLMLDLSQSLNAFYQTTVELGVADKVTTFTASDFGRTYKTNGKGSDHGWGNHQFVLGGAVRGGEIYGKVPVQQIGGPDDTTEGRWIPTIATEEFAATLALWFGVNASDLTDILPNINRFNRTNLGFIA
jgi:uncharacterized protein (DUF1501 family)